MAGVRRMMPALLMRMSMEPNSRTVRSTSEAQAWASATSASAGTAFEPEARTAAQTSSMPSAVGPWTTTLAPACKWADFTQMKTESSGNYADLKQEIDNEKRGQVTLDA